MKKIDLHIFSCSLFFMVTFITACTGQPDSKTPESNLPELAVLPVQASQIADYVVEIYEDKNGDLWFGTMSKGVARYDGKTLTYYTTREGLPGNTVASITEDKEGNLWLGTHSGLAKYDGETFTNFTMKDGLCHDRVSNILVDRKGNIWVGTWGGVCKFKDGTFSNFPIPIPEVELMWYQTTMDWITEIMEDSQGNIWFGRDGYGACKYDGITFTHFTKKEGLPSNNVQIIQEDAQGNIWFGSRVAERDNSDPLGRNGAGGLSRYDGKTIIQFPEIKGLSENDIYTIYEDNKENLWIGASGVGVYRYDGQSFHIYKETDRMNLTNRFGVQSILEDRTGTFWFGFSGGLFRLDGSSIVNVTQNGPWK